MDHYLPSHQEMFEDVEARLRQHVHAPSHPDDDGGCPFPTSSAFPAMSTVGGDNATAGNLNIEKEVESMITSRPNQIDPIQEWRKIQGNTAAKEILFASLVLALRKSGSFTVPTTNVFLFGPPGTGKTMLWQHAAYFKDWTVFVVRPSKILQTYQGQSRK